jgi:Raf kinase inhibitor-like YbhB/YbcL family protein
LRKLGTLLALAVLTAACGGQNTEVTIQAALNVNLVSPDFPAVPGPLSNDITCDGSDRPPSMTWSDPPPTARSLVVEMIDTSAPQGVFTHWLVYDIPTGARSLQPPLPVQAAQGRNDFGRTGYGGPCPPKGQTHIYLLLVYAILVDPSIPHGLTRSELEARFRDHVIGMGQLEGTYSR